MNSKLIFALALSVLSFACGSAEKQTAGEELKIEDGYKVNESNEIVIDDSAFNNKSLQIQKTTKAGELGSRVLNDKSEVTSMNDGHGNITETRNFPSTARIRMLIVRTSADGSRQVFVYGQDAAVKQMPAEMVDKALTASADEIANELKMYGGKITKLRPIAQQQPVRPLPSSSFPVRNNPTQVSENTDGEKRP